MRRSRRWPPGSSASKPESGPSRGPTRSQEATSPSRRAATKRRSPAQAAAIDELVALWPAVLDRLEASDGGAMLAALLEFARPVSVEDGRLVVSYPPSAAFS